MKKFLYILSVILTLCTLTEKLYSQSVSTQGKDFWLSYGNNLAYSYSFVDLQVRIVTDRDVTVTFTYKETGYVFPVTILAGNVYTHSLSDMEKNSVYSDVTGTSDKSLHIESTEPVSVYALNQVHASTDATSVLPIGGLGTDYYHISYKGLKFPYYMYINSDGYTLIATENNTEIYENGILATTLQKGQVYSYYAVATDMTGKHITSNHPIAYFVTNEGTWIPINTEAADNLFQQLPPVNTWGSNFLVPVTRRGLERVRIVASQDGTVINPIGGVITTDDGGYSTGSLNLNKGEFVELEISLADCGCFISSNKPVGVCSYLIGTTYNLPVKKGDPAMAWISPIEQLVDSVLIAPFIPTGTTNLNEHHVLLVTSTAIKDQTTVALGTNSATGLSGGSWCDNAASGYSFYSMQLSNNANDYYRFANPNGLVALGYGLGNAESYYYLAGCALNNLITAFYVNNIHYQTLNGDAICDTTVNFRAEIQYALDNTPGYLKWYVNGTEETAKRDSLTWSKILPAGNYAVSLVVLGEDGQKDSISSAFTISLPTHNTIKTPICLGETYYANGNGFNDFMPDTTGIYYQYQNLTNPITGCDSILTLQLTVNPVYDISIHDTIYEDEYYKVGDYQYNTPGLHISNLQTLEGCDSIINLTLDVIYYPSEITAFSPLNEDGINDYFMEGFKIQVFNRYGLLIYETKTKEQQASGWNGSNKKGYKVEPGMYFYILYNSGGKPIIKSSVEVLKK